MPTRVVPASPRIAARIAANVPLPLLVDRMRSARNWVSKVASLVGCPFTLLQRTRNGEPSVEVFQSW